MYERTCQQTKQGDGVGEQFLAGAGLPAAGAGGAQLLLLLQHYSLRRDLVQCAKVVTFCLVLIHVALLARCSINVQM